MRADTRSAPTHRYMKTNNISGFRYVGEDYCPPAIKISLNQQHMRIQYPPVQIDKWIPYHEFEITGRRGGLLSSRNKMFLNQQHMRTQDSPVQINKLIPYHEFEIQHVGEEYCPPVIIKIIESTIRADTRSAPTVLKIQYFDGECALLFCV
ncbi:hypothetical protein SDC9_65579 [bioreactor metagenome]|uniref:Uncharacterized protein n=1 Tax=bioreactor metagenome TaxID=1076179 RepID=A0A644XTS0_9ZZZZ